MLIKRTNSIKYAIQGLRVVIATQPNFQIHIVAASAVCVMSFCYKINAYEWLAIVLSISLVMMAEAINTALEFTCDAITDKKIQILEKLRTWVRQQC